MLAHICLSNLKFTCKLRQRYSGIGYSDPVLGLSQLAVRQVPRVPLPTAGVTLRGVISTITSAGITLLSSLIRIHAPDQNPPADFSFPFIPLVFAGCR